MDNKAHWLQNLTKGDTKYGFIGTMFIKKNFLEISKSVLGSQDFSIYKIFLFF